jgi:transcriptional regulator with XRE-family HTH domain
MKLKDYLIGKKLTLEQFASVIGVEPAAVSRYASGARYPRRDIMRRIVDATDGQVSPNDFLDAPPDGENDHARRLAAA